MVPPRTTRVVFFINDLLDALAFCDSYLLANDLILLSANLLEFQVQIDLQSLNNWLKENQMALTIEKCAKLTFRGKDMDFKLFGESLKNNAKVRELGIIMNSNLNWNKHMSKKVAKPKLVLCFLKRNVSFSVDARTKLGLYKSLFFEFFFRASSVSICQKCHDQPKKISEKSC